jgi:hypothetical protein
LGTWRLGDLETWGLGDLGKSFLPVDDCLGCGYGNIE